MIVFCTNCNTPYHQYCHYPPIEKEVVIIAEKDWFCSKCSGPTTTPIKREDGLVNGRDLTSDEVSTLSRLTTA